MGADTFATFRDNFAKKPHATLNKAWELAAHGDSNAHNVRGYMAKQDREIVLRGHWLPWLDALQHYSCADLPQLEQAPPTLILHGENDAVVHPDQAAYNQRLLPGATLHSLPGCGHAPHWHDAETIRERITAHIHSHVLECPPHG
jgi:pimeloyl-ACP methyl ester carboxylesterase